MLSEKKIKELYEKYLKEDRYEYYINNKEKYHKHYIERKLNKPISKENKNENKNRNCNK